MRPSPNHLSAFIQVTAALDSFRQWQLTSFVQRPLCARLGPLGPTLWRFWTLSTNLAPVLDGCYRINLENSFSMWLSCYLASSSREKVVMCIKRASWGLFLKMWTADSWKLVTQMSCFNEKQECEPFCHIFIRVCKDVRCNYRLLQRLLAMHAMSHYSKAAEAPSRGFHGDKCIQLQCKSSIFTGT